MSKELVFVVEPDAGRVTIEISQVPAAMVDDLKEDLGSHINVNCGRPSSTPRRTLRVLPSDREISRRDTDGFSIWLYDLYHNSTVDGPGRRSVVKVSGCSIRCENCYSRDTHERADGRIISISEIVTEIVSKRDSHDGVTILGGEPFDQPESVAELVLTLRNHGIHITVYSGYTLEQLIARKHPAIDYILTHIDLLIDGPFISEMGNGAGEYRGSRNQRIISLQTDQA
ncbi:MAG TPA: 4Fe-4S single cluster domain-containing protein [Pyrinomonadaceae bacterium]|nr:4Fe-4S single cluster domain-containing protein [Pyrinomonadaceae bacterium]